MQHQTKAAVALSAALSAAAFSASAAPPLIPNVPKSLQTVLKTGTSQSFTFATIPSGLATGAPKYSQLGTIDFACDNGASGSTTGSRAYVAPGTGGVMSFGLVPALEVNVSANGQSTVVNVKNNGAGFYCLVRVTSPGAEVP